MTDSLASAVDARVITGLLAAIVFSIVVSVFAVFQRARYLCILSVMAAAAFYWQAFAGFVIVSGLSYTVLRWVSGQPDQFYRWRCASTALICVIILFTMGRVMHWDRSMILPGVAPFVLYVLDMWLALRLVTLFWEVGSGAVPAPPLSRYIVWTCLPLTLGGPLVRYSQLPATFLPDRSLWKSWAWWMDVAAGTAMLIAGLALVPAQRTIAARLPQALLWNSAVTGLFTGPVGFYLSTAGYFQLMESLGRPCGFTVPRSFNCPLGRENISAFWANWNMTATTVFRDYIFYNRWGMSAYNVYFNTMVLFVLVGLWHAADAYWLLWGFLHGLLFCGFLLWRKYGQRLGPQSFRGMPVSRLAARALTYVCVCACWYLPSKILQKVTGA